MTIKLMVGIPHAAKKLVLNMARFVHLKRKSTYTVLFQGKLQVATRPVVEGDVLIAYLSELDGQVYYQLHEEFHDGRFGRIDDNE